MLQDLIIALFSQLDMLSGAVLALNFGFFMLPSALGYLTGALGSLLTGSITPVSFMYESLVLSFNLSPKFKERISMILAAALLTGIAGIFGLPQLIVDKTGPEIFLAMLAGVGLYLAKVGFDLAKDNLIIGVPCFITAILVQVLTNDLILTVALSIPLGFLINIFLENKSKITPPHYHSWHEMIKQELKIIKPIFNHRVAVGALALSVLTIGGNVAYTAANHQLAGAGAPTYNQATIISSVADFASSLFGGGNMELIISPTAAAPNPLRAAILYMLLAALILSTGLVHKLAGRLPISAMGGYLFVIGAMLILPYNALDAFKIGDPIVISLTMAITFFTNPFYGLMSGVCLKLLLP